MTEKKRNTWYWILKVFSVVISCFFPIYSVCEHFPLWTETHGVARSVGAGTVISIVVVAIIFRESVFKFIKTRFKLETAPPLSVWLILIAISYVLIYIGKFLEDLVVVFWMGFVGCAIGTLITYIAEHKFGKKEEKNE